MIGAPSGNPGFSHFSSNDPVRGGRELFGNGFLACWKDYDPRASVDATAPGPSFQIIPNYLSPGTNDQEQPTKASEPARSATAWNGELLGAVYDGASTWMMQDALAADFTGTDEPMLTISAVEHDGTSAFRVIISLGNSANNNPLYQFRIQTGNMLETLRRNTTGASTKGNISTSVLGPGRYILCDSFDGSDGRQYVDGALDAGSPFDLAVGAMAVDRLTIGGLGRIAVGNFFLGSMRERWLVKPAFSDAHVASASRLLASLNPQYTFRPTYVPNCVAWWDPLKTDSVTVTAGRVSGILDRSNTANDLAEVGVDGPVYEPQGWNGLPSMAYDGVAQYLVSPSLAAYVTGDDHPFTIFLMVEWITKIANSRMWSFGNSGDATIYCDALTDGTNVNVGRRVGGAVAANGSTVATGRKVWCETFFGMTVSTWFNNSIDINAAPLDTPSLNLNRFALACLARTIVGSFSNIRLAEVIVYDRAVSDAERTQVTDYLINKWTVS